MSGYRMEVSMRKNSFGETVILVMMVIGIFLLVGMICDESAKNKCILKGCDNKRAPGSSYCYLHKSYGKLLPDLTQSLPDKIIRRKFKQYIWIFKLL